ncbi:hypothetical protein F4861DRAFT_143478 [Xylaria intraflava]|nr:hypothetical protein F4861DRAFT_143478 [Xylaria intraflava]
MPSHKHQHARHAHQHWDNFVRGVENVANELNPFKDTLQARSPETLTVYTTMSPTFPGAVAGWSTIGVPANPTQNANSGDSVTAPSSQETANPNPQAAPQADAGEAPGSLPESLLPSTSVNLAGESTLAVAGTSPLAQQPTTFQTTNSPSPTAATALSSPTSSASASSSGASPATQAGIAIGVLGGVFALGLLVFFVFKKRRKQAEQQQPLDHEKVNGPSGGHTDFARSGPSELTAPQLSLRPVTQFNPTFNERRSSKGAGLMLATAAANPPNAAQERGGSMWERPSTAHSNNPQNPFNDSARAYSPTGNGPAASPDPASNPFDSPEHVVGMAQTTDATAGSDITATAGNGAVAVAAATAAAAAAAAATPTGTSLTRKESTRKQAPEALDLTTTIPPPSPTGTEYSMHSVAPGQSPVPSKSAAEIAAAGGPPSTAVHRVQLDFQPSMDDELELQAGHLVRILHEYDDGWALCIRLDRSQQGVVPRTCLSTRPVKPRPAGGPPGSRSGGPPVNPSRPQGPSRGPGPNYPPNYQPGLPPNGRPESPMRPNGRPQSPAHIRPYSPAEARPISPLTVRSVSPAGAPPMNPGPRAQSPGPRAQRPQSPSEMSRRNNTPGPSPMNPSNIPGAAQQYRGSPGSPRQEQAEQKPVPGQAY